MGRFRTKSVLDRDGGKAGCLVVVRGGREPQRAEPHPDVLVIRVKHLVRVIGS